MYTLPLLHHRKFSTLPVWTPGRILQLRLHLGYSQQDLADSLGIRRTTVMFWEGGRSTPLRRHRLNLTMLADNHRFPVGE
jgi:DNA-binding XRE family transcriptional regulator